MFLRTFSFGPLATTAILFACEETRFAAVIDPGEGSCPVLLKVIQENDLILKKILLTHSHWDHIAGLYELDQKTEAPVYVHLLDRENVEHPGSDGLPLLFPIRGVQVDFFLEAGQVLKVGTIKVHVLHTPGHSPGGVCFYLPEENILFSGDTLFRGTIGNLELPTASAESMWPSLKKLAGLPAKTRVIPGHGRETSLAEEPWIHNPEKYFS